MTITRDEVELAYRLLLGRMPENEAAYEYGLSAGTLETLRRWLMNSPEFARTLQRETPTTLRRWMLAEQRQRNRVEAPQAAPETAGDTPPRIVFLHIMKTAGTSLRTRLEELLPGEPFWRFEEKGRPGDATVADLAPHRCFMGHFNFADAWHVPGPKRIFTVLREPRARVLSLYHFLARHRAEVITEKQLRAAAIAREHSLLDFLRHPDAEVRASLQNHMTCVLAGDYRPIGANLYTTPWGGRRGAIGGTALLRIALENLRRIDFVTSVERLEHDRPRLMAALGLPDTGPIARENTRELVNAVVEPRPETEVTPEAQAELMRLTELDRMLVRLANIDIR
jgi:hypothetical protein